MKLSVSEVSRRLGRELTVNELVRLRNPAVSRKAAKQAARDLRRPR